MNSIGYLVFGYMVFGVLLVFAIVFLKSRLFRHIYTQYPEEGKVIKLYMWQRYHGFMLRKAVNDLIKKQSSYDFELVKRSKMAKLSIICFLVWFILALIMFFVCLLFLIMK